MDERDLLKRLQNKDEDALEKIIERYNDYVTVIVREILIPKGQREDIEEVIADTFIALWNTAERVNYEEYSSIKAYIGMIARNKAKDRLRVLKRWNLHLNEDAFTICDSMEQFVIQKEQQLLIMSFLKKMSEEDGKIFVMYYYYYYKVNEIGEILGLNVQTVKTRLRRGRMLLKKLLCAEGYTTYEN